MLLAALVAVATLGLIWMLSGGAVWLTRLVLGTEAWVAANFVKALATFGVTVFVIQLLALPGGTVAVLSGGFLFGAPAAAIVYYLTQVAAAPVVYMMVGSGLASSSKRFMPESMRRRLPRSLLVAIDRAKDEAVLSVIVFRLAPVLTSTFVPALAALLGLPLRAVVVGSLLVSWIKPSITASLGAAARSLSEATDPGSALAQAGLAPFAMLFAASVALLVLRVWLRRGGLSVDGPESCSYIMPESRDIPRARDEISTRQDAHRR